MKKIVLLMFLVGAALTVNAQVYVGGSLGFWNNDDHDFTNFTIAPEIGYNFSEKWAVGAEIAYIHQKIGKGKANGFEIAPYARFNYLKTGMLRLFVDGGFAYMSIKPKGLDSFDGFEIGLKPGLALDVTDNISLVTKFGFLGYRDDYGLDMEDGVAAPTSNGFGLGILGENLTFGIQVKF